MRVDVSHEGSTIRFDLDGVASGLPEGKAKLARSVARVALPAEVRYEDIHPDSLALAALLIAHPWAEKTISVSTGASARFAGACRESLGVDIGPVRSTIPPRERPDSGTPGLCYSGGVDSTAALALMPPATRLFFLDRTEFGDEQTRSLYRKDAALHACRELEARGYHVDVVPTDLELLRDPIGFPTDLANAVPLVLLANARGIDSVGWGTIAESAYRIGDLQFQDYAGRSGFTGWGAVFEAVGLPFFNCVTGISEVGTSIIVLKSPLGELAQSCIRGDVEAPCGRCWKCFRKSLLDSALKGTWPSNDDMDSMLRSAEVRKFICKVPLKHEDVLTYALRCYTGNHPAILALKAKVRSDTVDATWLERWYQPSLDLIPSRYRAETAQRINEFLDPMDADDEVAFRSWDLREVITSHDYAEASRKLESVLAGYVPVKSKKAKAKRSLARRIASRIRSLLARRVRKS